MSGVLFQPIRLLVGSLFLTLLFAQIPFVHARVDITANQATSATATLETGKVLEIQAHPEGRPFDWINEGETIPIYDAYPYYDITIRLGDKTYLVRYEAMTGYYPTAWQTGKEVKVRVADGQMFVLRYDGQEVPMLILQH